MVGSDTKTEVNEEHGCVILSQHKSEDYYGRMKEFIPPLLIRDTLSKIEAITSDYVLEKIDLTSASEQFSYLIIDAIETAHVKELSTSALTLAIMGHIGSGKDVLTSFLGAPPTSEEIMRIVGARNGKLYTAKDISGMSKEQLTSLEGLIILNEQYEKNKLFTDFYSKGTVPYTNAFAAPTQDTFRNDRGFRDMIATILPRRTALILNRTSIEDAIFAFVNLIVKFKDDWNSYYKEHTPKIEECKQTIEEALKTYTAESGFFTETQLTSLETILSKEQLTYLNILFKKENLISLKDAGIGSYDAIKDLNQASELLLKNYLVPFLQHAIYELAMYDGIVFLDCSAKELLARVDRRDRKEEEWLKTKEGRKYYLYLQDAYTGLRNALKKRYGEVRSKLLIVNATVDIGEDIKEIAQSQYKVNPDNVYLNQILNGIYALQLRKLQEQNRIIYD